jgi:hypothetical protein
MASEEDAPRSFRSQQVHGTAQAFTIARSHGWERWPARTRLTKGQIAAQHKISGIGESIGQSNQQFALAVCPSTVRKNQSISIRLLRRVQKAAHGRLNQRI